MMNVVIAALVLAPLAAQARTSDPLGSAECAAARAELEAALDDGISNARARAARLATARRLAALACLGPASGQPQRSGAPEPAQVVPPPVISVPSARPVQPAAGAAPLPPLAIPRPAAITTCDPAGCWDSDGRRVNQIGPLLMGPRGVCSVHGGVVNCP